MLKLHTREFQIIINTVTLQYEINYYNHYPLPKIVTMEQWNIPLSSFHSEIEKNGENDKIDKNINFFSRYYSNGTFIFGLYDNYYVKLMKNLFITYVKNEKYYINKEIFKQIENIDYSENTLYVNTQLIKVLYSGNFIDLNLLEIKYSDNCITISYEKKLTTYLGDTDIFEIINIDVYEKNIINITK